MGSSASKPLDLDEFQNKVMSQAQYKMDKEQEEGGAKGIVLNLSMGLGKTRTALALATKQTVNKITVLVPYTGIKASWNEDWEKFPKKENYELETYDFKEFAQLENFEGGRTLIVDEVHLVESVPDVDAFLKKIRTSPKVATVGLTGTILSDSFRDLLVTLNVVMPENKAPSLNERLFLRDYFKVPWYRFFQAWIKHLVTFQVVSILSPYYLADATEFYTGGVSSKSRYATEKRKIVQKVLGALPFFRKKVFDMEFEDLSRKEPFTVLSFIIYRTLINPFSFVLPSILLALTVKSRNDITRPDTRKLREHFGPYIVREVVKYQPQRIHTAMSALKVSSKQETFAPTPEFKNIYPTVVVDRTRIPYSTEQAQRFVRFTLGLLTPEDFKELSTPERVQNDTSLEYIEEVGLRIGSTGLAKMQFVVDQIRKKRAKRVVVYTRFRTVFDTLKKELPKLLGIEKVLIIKVFVQSKQNKNLTIPKKNIKTRNEMTKTNYKENGSEKSPSVMLLVGDQYIGLDGIMETDTMFILEPLASYGKLQQLRARVARNRSHSKPSESTVNIYELYCSTDWRKKVSVWRENFKNIRMDVFPGLQDRLFGQMQSPDQLVMTAQKRKREFVEAFDL